MCSFCWTHDGSVNGAETRRTAYGGDASRHLVVAASNESSPRRAAAAEEEPATAAAAICAAAGPKRVVRLVRLRAAARSRDRSRRRTTAQREQPAVKFFSQWPKPKTIIDPFCGRVDIEKAPPVVGALGVVEESQSATRARACAPPVASFGSARSAKWLRTRRRCSRSTRTRCSPSSSASRSSSGSASRPRAGRWLRVACGAKSCPLLWRAPCAPASKRCTRTKRSSGPRSRMLRLLTEHSSSA